MNYSSLAILSRCPQAPVPNLGQYNHQSLSSSSASSVPSEGQSDPSHLLVSGDHQHGADSDVNSAAQRSTYLPSNMPAMTINVQPSSGQFVPASSVSPAAGAGSVVSDNVTATSLSSGFVGTVDDDFDDFKTAPASTSAGSISLSG